MAAHVRRQVARTAHVAMDVTFDALTPAIGADGQASEAADSSTAATRLSVGKGHLEQAGRWTGWIESGGERKELGPNARGNRDKSWGPRRWGGPKMWRWFSINIDDDTHFGGIVIGTDGGDLHRGWVWRDGAHESIAEWKVTSELEDDGVTHRTHVVTRPTRPAATHELDADVLRVEPGTSRHQARTTIVNEGLARWTYEGRTGTGHQRVPPPARRRRPPGRADHLEQSPSRGRAQQAPRSLRASPRGPAPAGRG